MKTFLNTHEFEPLIVFVCLFLINLSGIALAQSLVIENVDFEVLEDDLVVVEYDLLGKNNFYIVEMVLYRKGSPAFKYVPFSIAGDVGKGNVPGLRKKIVWSMKHDKAKGLDIDPFAEDYYFVIKAYRKPKRWGWWFLLAIGGGATYYFLEVKD